MKFAVMDSEKLLQDFKQGGNMFSFAFLTYTSNYLVAK